MKQRNHAFDLLCGVCIVRMMMLHISDNCGISTQEWWQNVMHWSFYFMSFFFFKAGYFNKTVAGDSKGFIIGKFKSLMVPYFVWGAVGSAIYLFFCAFILPPQNHLVRALNWQHLWETSAWYGNSPTWFLFCFFTAYVSMHLISKAPSLAIPVRPGKSLRIKIHWAVLIFPWISYKLCQLDNPLWMDLDNVFWGIFLFFLGRLWRVVLERYPRSTAMAISVLLLIAFVVMNALDEGEYSMMSNTWTGYFPITLVKIVCSLCGLSGLLIMLRVPAVPVLDYIGRHSMVYFVGHYPIITFYKMVRSASVHTLNHHWDDWIILIFITFTICTLLVPHVEKVPWMSGRYKKDPLPSTPFSSPVIGGQKPPLLGGR